MMALLAPLCSAQTIQRTEYVYRPLRQQGQGGGPFAGVLPGIALVTGSAAVLWWNEGRTAANERLLGSARRRLVHADAEHALDAGNDGELVHLYSSTLDSAGLSDLLFPDVRRSRAARLRRKSEAFQWEETEHTHETRVSHDTVKRTKSYSYQTAWRAHTVSGAFHDGGRHSRPAPRVEPGLAATTATDAKLANGVPIEAALLEQLDDWRSVPLAPAAPAEERTEVSEGSGRQRELAGGAAASLTAIDGAALASLGDGTDCIYVPLAGFDGASGSGGGGPSRDAAPSLSLPSSVESYMQGERRRGAAPMPRLGLPPQPQVGDARVRFAEVPFPQEGVSILAQQAGTRALRPWQGPGEHTPSRAPTLYMLVAGRVSAQEMLRRARADSDRRKWLLRGGGAALMWAGIGLSLSWVPALASRLPLLGGLVGSLAGAGVGLVSLGSAAGLSGLLIAMAWARFRPASALGLLASAAATYFSLAKLAIKLNAAQSLGTPGAGGSRQSSSA